ncbi:hypothetical protein NON20_11665 [Synechocystis sp. B12]|nr:hypothetical protein NON20_11665 [Synechocystis sp. B12]
MKGHINAPEKVSPHRILKLFNLMAVFGLLGQGFWLQAPALS